MRHNILKNNLPISLFIIGSSGNTDSGMLIFILSVLFILNIPLILFTLSQNYRDKHKSLLSAYISFLTSSNSFYTFNESSNEFGINEINIAKVLLSFLKLKKVNIDDRNKILTESFHTYSQKLFIEISYRKINMLIHNYSEKEINIKDTCKKISKLSTKHRLFLLYSLMDIAAFDQVYSNEEEKFINNIRQMIKIPVLTFNVIKTSYTNRGMKDERIIIEEQNRKKTAKSFLPYNAYKILGVSPSVTKSQLKKAYRTLAKKYHPDKYHGQSDEIIQKAEDKFQEILEAYELVKRFKGLS